MLKRLTCFKAALFGKDTTLVGELVSGAGIQVWPLATVPHTRVPQIKVDKKKGPKPRLVPGQLEMVKKMYVVHFLEVASSPGSGPGRTSSSTKRSAEFVKQYATKYEELQQPRSCLRGREIDSKTSTTQEVLSGLQQQKALQESRKDAELGQAHDTDDECVGHISTRDVEAGLAPVAAVLTLSPAEKALQLVQQKLLCFSPLTKTE